MAFNIHISGPKMILHNKTIADMFVNQLNNNQGLFGIDCSTGKEYSYPKLKKDVLAMATTFQKHDLGHGDVVMITDYGSYEGQVVMLAGILVGTTIAALDHSLRKSVLTELINESKPSVLFCNTFSINIITDILNTITHQPTLKISTMIRDGFTAYSNIVVAADEISSVRPIKSKSPIGPCAIIYSSGTTGTPKGIYLSDDAMKSALISFKQSLMEEPIEKRFMITSPVFWYTGILLMMLGIHFGKPRLFFSAKSTAEQILCSIDKFKPTFLMTGVAAVNEMMACQMANGHKYNIQSLTTCVVGGSPMRADLQKTVVNNLLQGRIPIKQGYGASEQGIIAVWSMDSDIVSLETGECVGPNVEGEIRIKSVSDMVGYVNDMKKTICSYDEDGWFKSGDVGYYTDDCCLFIVGRIKELMIYKDQRIAPIDIETVLLSHPAVLDAGVTGKYSVDGDLLVGVVKVKPGQNVEPDRLLSYVNDRVKDHERLRGGIIFVDDVPRSPAGKLKREELLNIVQ
ncbi:luciferin 4-monooxygenase-like isoform X2 [Myzus persicae]|uniref:luciferin 4-monooxygenase-like isoform X2 n=1 Tax=Myzus persicae TaxID=13164 RepID=UPI000B92FBCE|nr:luciferin 4-monooxygenase-like isoform X2 [Myzus persicae]